MKLVRKLMIALEALLTPIAEECAVYFNTTGAKIGYGSKLKRGDGASPENFTAVAEITDIGKFGSTAKNLDVTNLDSPNGYMEYILGMKDGVTMTVVANFLPTDSSQSYAAGLIEDHINGTRRNFQLAVNGAGTFSFAALVMSWDAAIKPDVPMTATFSLKISGAITYA